MKNLLHFIQYHNAVPLALGIVMLGGGVTFAATNPEVIYSEEQRVLSIDNSYLANKDLSNWTPQIRIEGVTEDDASYYVAYTLSTIDLDGYAWKDVTKAETMSVSKSDLGEYRDLGVYVTQQLRQIIDRDLQKLRQTQEIEKRNVSLAVVATAYGGLVGQMLNDSTEVLPGYVPVVTGPPVQVAAAAAPGLTSSADSTSSSQAGGVSAPQSGGTLAVGSVLSGDPSDTEPPYLQILGSASILLQAGDYYLDLGAVAADNGRADLVEVSLYLNGAKVERVYMPSAKAGEWTITYEARDKAGNITRVERHITVSDATPAPTPIPEPPPPAPAPEPEPTPTPTPEPEPTPTPEPEPSEPSSESTDSSASESTPAEPTPASTPEPEPTPTPTPPTDTPAAS